MIQIDISNIFSVEEENEKNAKNSKKEDDENSMNERTRFLERRVNFQRDLLLKMNGTIHMLLERISNLEKPNPSKTEPLPLQPENPLPLPLENPFPFPLEKPHRDAKKTSFSQEFPESLSLFDPLIRLNKQPAAKIGNLSGTSSGKQIDENNDAYSD